MNFLLTLSKPGGNIDATLAPASGLANEANTNPQAFLGLILFALLLGSLVLWSRFLVAYIKGIPFLPTLEARPIQRWGIVDLVMAVASVFLLSVFAATVLTRLGVQRTELVNGPASSLIKISIATFQLLSVVVMTLLIAVRYRVPPISIGWSTKYLMNDIRLGLITFVMVLPPIYVLMILSTVLFNQPYSHPVVEAIKKDPSTLPMAIWLAVIIAPILEEFGFRVLLQGCLESIARGPFSLKLMMFGRRDIEPTTDVAIDSKVLDVNEKQIKQILSLPFNPYHSENKSCLPSVDMSVDIEGQNNKPEMVVDSRQLPWWPVGVSGLLFGLAHFDYGASWLPLVVFGMILGYLYRITNRIWPSLVVHMCLNGMTMLNLTVITLYGDPSQIP